MRRGLLTGPGKSCLPARQHRESSTYSVEQEWKGNHIVIFLMRKSFMDTSIYAVALWKQIHRKPAGLCCHGN